MSKKIKYKNIIVYTYTKIFNKKSNKKYIPILISKIIPRFSSYNKKENEKKTIPNKIQLKL